MKKRISIPVCILLIVLCCTITFQVTYIFAFWNRSSNSRVGYYNDKLAAIDRIYRENFVGEIDDDALTDALINGYLAGVGEKYGYYLNAEDFAVHDADFEGEYVGIGLSVVLDEGTGMPKVVTVTENSPAHEAGIQPGDLVYKIDGALTVDIGYDETVDAVKGEAGTTVDISILRGQEKEEIALTIERRAIVSQAVFYKLLDCGIAFVRVTTFNTQAAKEFTEALDKMKKDNAWAVIFDMRDNRGGEEGSAVTMIDPLIPEGDMIVLRDKNGKETVEVTSDANELDLPIAVLTNGWTASAAELFSQCIRDYEKGVLVGETTFGKFTMQSGRQLADGSVLYISTHNFSSKSREILEGKGLTPDIEVSLPEELANKNLFDIAEQDDTVLQAAIEYLKNNK